MGLAHLLLHRLVCGLSSLIMVVIVGAAAANGLRSNLPPTSISAKLVHRDLVIRPPLTTDSSDYDIQTETLPDGVRGIFLINVSIGQPRLPQLLVMDSGSSLTLVRRFGCTGCENEEAPLYNPSKSSTFRNLTCDSKYCRGFYTSCDYLDRCISFLRFGDKRKGTAVLTTETFSFMTYGDSDELVFIDVRNMVFGCVNWITWEGLEGVHGVLGLGPKIVSLAQRLNKFSYCIGSLSDRFYPFNLLIIGERARTQGYSTPMEITGQYYVTLQGISVGDNGLDIMPEVFQVKVIMDTGAAKTRLLGDAYDQLKKEIKRVLEGKLHLITGEPNLCYDGTLKQDFGDFPFVTLHFADGANLVLEAASVFTQYVDKMVCLAVKKVTPGEEGGVPLIGMLAQQNYNIGYDLEEKKLYIERLDCSILDDY